MLKVAESDGSKEPSVMLEPWQERLLRRHHKQYTQAELGSLCGRSRTWAQAALKLLGLKTRRAAAFAKEQP